MARSQSRFDSPLIGEMFKAKQGDNTVRILPPTWPDPEHYCLQVWEHRYVGPDESHYLCLRKMQNKPCPICDAEKAAKDHGDLDAAKKLKPMGRWVCYVLHRDADDKNVRNKPLVWDMNGYQDEEIVGRTYEKKTNKSLNVTHPEHGYDLSFRRTGQGDRTRYVNFEFDRDPSPIFDDQAMMDEVLEFIEQNPLDQCLRFYDFDYLENMMYGTVEAADDELDQPNDDPTAGADDEDLQKDEDRGEGETEQEVVEDTDPPEGEDGSVEDAADDGEPDVSTRPARRPLREREERQPPSRQAPRQAPRQRPHPSQNRFRD